MTFTEAPVELLNHSVQRKELYGTRKSALYQDRGVISD